MDYIRIGIGTTVLCRGLATTEIDGIGNYTQQVLSCLSAESAIRLVPFAFGSNTKLSSGQVPVRLKPFKLGSLPSLLAGWSYLGSGSLRRRVDLVHAMDHLIPRINGVPVVATIMDAIPLIHPEWVGYRFRVLKNAIWRRTADFADHIVTISEHAKGDLIRYFDLPVNMISVTPLGVDQRWFEEPTPEHLQSLRNRYHLPSSFMVFVGTLQPRKNVARIIDAHRILPASIRETHPLLIIGRAGWQCTDVLERLQTNDAYVRWLKYVPGDDLPSIVRCASVMVFPSLHEGFGLPVLEAFASGLPVVTSNVTSLPEVASDAALLVDPYDLEQISSAMQRLLEDSDLAGRLRRAGLARAAKFTWQQTAATTLAVYRQVLS